MRFVNRTKPGTALIETALTGDPLYFYFNYLLEFRLWFHPNLCFLHMPQINQTELCDFYHQAYQMRVHPNSWIYSEKSEYICHIQKIRLKLLTHFFNYSKFLPSKMEYQDFLCILQKNSAMATVGLKKMGKFAQLAVLV